MSGKLARIEAQEREMMAKMGLPYSAPPQQLAQEEWTKVKSKKRSKKIHTEATSAEELKPDTTADSIEDALYQTEYQAKSKKKEKKQRKLDEELSKALAAVSTTENGSADQVMDLNNDSSQNCRSSDVLPTHETSADSLMPAKPKKKKKSKASSLSDPEAKISLIPTKTPKRKRRQSEAQMGLEETEIIAIEDDSRRKKSSKKRKHNMEPETPFEVDHFKKAISSGQLPVVDEIQENRKLVKAQRKKNRQIRRLAKEMDRDMHILW